MSKHKILQNIDLLICCFKILLIFFFFPLFFHLLVSSCITTYKKTPPPVPPRTTSKPFISVTVQSSTESAQDTYLDNQDHKSDINSQSGLSNSSDSLDSARALNSTKTGSVSIPLREQSESHHRNATVTTDIGSLVSEDPKLETLPKRKLSSIGIQVISERLKL